MDFIKIKRNLLKGWKQSYSFGKIFSNHISDVGLKYHTTLPVSWETCMQAKKQQLKTDMEKWTSSKLGKEYIKAAYCHPAYLTYMQNISCEMLDWMNHKLESRLLGEVSITSDMQMTPPLDRKWRRTKEPLDESEREEWKS